MELTLIQLAQLTGSEEEPSGGLSPKTTIKPIFNKQASNNASTTANKPSAPSVHPAEKVSEKVVANAGVSYPQSLKTEEHKVKKVKDISSLSISITKRSKDASKETAQVSKESTSTPTLEKQPISLNDLKSKWEQYANNLPFEQVAMAKKMLNTQIDLLDETKIEIKVDNTLAANDFQTFLPDIKQYLQKALHNDMLDIAITINESKEQQKAFTKTERFQEMAEKNHTLLDLKNEFALEFFN